MILVAGATGFLGREICRRLGEQGQPVRGLARASSDASIVAELEAMGMDIVRGDLRDRSSLDAACRGVTTLISTVTTTRSRQPGDSIEATDQQGQLDLVDAARRAGVRRLIFVSFSDQIGGNDALTATKRSVERRISETGITSTIVRPSFFMEMWLSPALGFDHPNGSLEVVRIFEDAAGRPFTVHHVRRGVARTARLGRGFDVAGIRVPHAQRRRRRRDTDAGHAAHLRAPLHLGAGLCTGCRGVVDPA
jgi:uncharacterized protein YbjT (DUF2867 family)